MRYRPGDHFVAISHSGDRKLYVTRDHWAESPIRPDWFEVLGFDGGWDLHYPNGAGVFSSRRITRDGVDRRPPVQRHSTVRWAKLFHRNDLWQASR